MSLSVTELSSGTGVTEVDVVSEGAGASGSGVHTLICVGEEGTVQLACDKYKQWLECVEMDVGGSVHASLYKP